MGDMWDLQGWYTEWEMNGRYVGLTGVVYRVEDEWEVCGTYRDGIQNGRYVQHPTSEAICNEIVLTMETGDVKSLNVCHFAGRFFGRIFGFKCGWKEAHFRFRIFRAHREPFFRRLCTAISAILKLE